MRLELKELQALYLLCRSGRAGKGELPGTYSADGVTEDLTWRLQWEWVWANLTQATFLLDYIGTVRDSFYFYGVLIIGMDVMNCL